MRIHLSCLIVRSVAHLAATLAIVTGLALPARAADQVSVTQNDADEPVVLVDAAYPAGAGELRCDNDRPFFPTAVSAGTVVVPIGNAGAADDCATELVVFSDGNALALIERPDLSPTDADIAVILNGRVAVPVFTWMLAAEPVSDTDKALLEAEFDADLIEADGIFDRSHTGIAFTDAGIEFVIDPDWVPRIVALARAVMAGAEDPAGLLEALRDQLPLLGGAINALRLPANDISGFHISDADGASSGVVAIGVATSMGGASAGPTIIGSTATTLAHELGHAMSLDHVNYLGVEVVYERGGSYCVAYGEPDFYDGECDFEPANLMWGGMTGLRDHLTEGQAFRTAVNGRSFINHNPNSPDPPLRDPAQPRRDCADWDYHAGCPYIAVEVAP